MPRCCRPAWAAPLAAAALLGRGCAASERGAPDPQEENWWLHLDFLVPNLDCGRLGAPQRARSSAAVASALVALCGVDLRVMSLEAAADTVSLGSPAVCSWSPSHWKASGGSMVNAVISAPAHSAPIIESAVRSEQFRTMLASIFGPLEAEAGPLEVADVTLVPLMAEDDGCGGAPEAPEGGEEDDEARFVLAPACSTGGSPAPEPALARGSEVAGRVVCCAQGGSGSSRSVGGLCLSTGTSSPSTYLDAVGICMGAGLRLCDTQEELDGSCGPECGLDGALVWTAERRSGAGGALGLGQGWRSGSLLIYVLIVVLVCAGCWCVWRCGPCRKRSSKHQLAEQDAFVGERERCF